MKGTVDGYFLKLDAALALLYTPQPLLQRGYFWQKDYLQVLSLFDVAE
jgi:hypothetical protein